MRTKARTVVRTAVSMAARTKARKMVRTAVRMAARTGENRSEDDSEQRQR